MSSQGGSSKNNWAGFVGAAALLAVLIFATTAQAQTFSGYYKIVSQTSGMVLDGRGATVAGSNVGQYTDVVSDNLRWQLVDMGSGYFKIQNKATGLVLDGKGLTTAGSLAGQWSDVVSDNLRWQVVAT